MTDNNSCNEEMINLDDKSKSKKYQKDLEEAYDYFMSYIKKNTTDDDEYKESRIKEITDYYNLHKRPSETKEEGQQND